MKVRNFLNSLLPSFKKDQVIEDCRITRDEIKQFSEPAYSEALGLFKSWKFKSPAIEAQMATFSRLVKPHGNMVATIAAGWKPILENLDQVEELAKSTFGEYIAGSGLTYLKANLLQFIEAAAFVSKYARKLLIYVYICETAEFEGSGTSLNASLTPAEIEWLNVNFISFCTAFNVAAGNPVQIKKQLAEIPDILVTNENAETLTATMGATRVDPFQMRLIPLWMNPIYHVRMAVAEWQVSRYKAAQEELKLVQLRKLNLEKLHAGKPDASVQHQIEYLEQRISGLNFKIAQMEKANA